MNEDRDYIKNKFDSDGIKAPDSLSEENMLAMLEAAEKEQSSAPEEKTFEKRSAVCRPLFKRAAAVAAAAVVAVFGIAGINKLITAPPDTSVASGELYTFSNEREISNLIKDIAPDSRFRLFPNDGDELLEYETSTTNDIAVDNMEAPLSGGSQDTGASKALGSSHSETYLQVDDVDEADIVKTDGKYIYYVTDRAEVVILSAENGKTEKLATVGSSGVENYIQDIYIKGDRLITVGTLYYDDSDEEVSGIVVYDISDRKDPKMLYDFSQTGSILNSRMVGDCLYLVTNDYVYAGGDRIVPMCGSDGSLIRLAATDICCMPNPADTSYVILSAIDITSGKQGRPTTKAILGAGYEIYCNDHNLYTTSEEWDDDYTTSYTRIVRASLDGTKVKFNATTKVRGRIDSQFSMDERDGYFRIATTSQRAGMDVNNLYVLDKDLKECGKVTGFARNESIKAVRFIGEKAYVITYEEIDPLFIIDLSDPAEPKIEGEVKIDGFSTLLIPISSDRLLGIGHATGDNGYGGEYDSGLKLALFDISNPSKPKVLDSKEFEDMSSFAQSDHHALMMNSDAGYFGIPYEIWNYSVVDGGVLLEDEDTDAESDDLNGIDQDPGYETGVLLFKAGDRISSVDKHELEGQQIYRSVYIGDWIYALDGEGNVQGFRIK